MDELGRALARWLMGHDTLDDITGVSLQKTWFDRPGRPSVDPLETLRPAATLSEEAALLEGGLRMPPPPNFRGAPALRGKFAGLPSRKKLLRHPLLLSAAIGLVGALLVVLVLKLSAGGERTVRPTIRVLAEKARSLTAQQAEPAQQANGEVADEEAAEPVVEDTAEAEGEAQAEASAKPVTVSAPTRTNKAAPRPPPVTKLKNPFQ
jgi:hypothetical protein